MQTQLYPVIVGFIGFCALIVVFLMLLRLIVNYTDPNPFGRIGRASYKLKKYTDRFVYPVARGMANYKIDTRLAPLVVMFAFIIAGYFVIQLCFYILFTIDGIVESAINPSIMRLVGYLLYGVLSVYSLLIIVRIILSWISSPDNRITRFLMKITDPVLEPFRKLIPPLGMFDLSPIVVLLLLSFITAAVRGVLIGK